MTTWLANITITLQDEGAAELYALTGITTNRPASPSGSVSVRVTADTLPEAFRQALEDAARLVEH